MGVARTRQLDLNRDGAVAEWGLASAARAIRDSRISVADYVVACLDSAGARDTELQAFGRFEAAYLRKRAYVFDRMPSDKRGPLHGVPVAMGEPEAAPGDGGESLATRAIRAGAILAGTTRTAAFGCFGPGPTRNPYGADRSAGGSGAAAAVAAGMVPVSFDIRPDGAVVSAASYCGVYGLRVVRDSALSGGRSALTTTLDAAGLYVRSAEDVGFACRTVLGLSTVPDDPNALAQRTEGLSVRLLETASDYRIQPSVRSAINRAITILADARVETGRLRLPPRFVEAEATYETIFSYEVARRLAQDRDRDADGMHPAALERIDRGRRIDASAYEQARRDAIALRSALLDMMEDDTVFLCAAVEDVAPLHAADSGWSPMAALWAIVGVPSLVVPFGRTGGLPVGVRVVAAPGREDLLARIACIMEPELTVE